MRGRAYGRVDFGRIELVRNGKVIAKAQSRPVGRHFEAEMSISIAQSGPGWLALRTPPPPVEGDPELQHPVPKNELGRDLFAHTSAINVDVGGRTYFDRKVAEQLLAEMTKYRDFISDKGLFADDQERQRVLDVYRDGIAEMNRRLRSQTN